MAIVTIPRTLGGTLLLTLAITPPAPVSTNSVLHARDGQTATLHVRDGRSAILKTRKS